MEVVKLLLGNGANPNLQDSSGATPLNFALENINLEVAELLLKNGANPNSEYPTTRDNEEKITLIEALALRKIRRVSGLRDDQILRIINLLYSYGGEIRKKLLDDMNINPEIKTGIEETNKHKEKRDCILLNDNNFINAYKNLILHGNLNLEHLNTGINDDIADGINDGINDDIAVNNIIGDVMFKAIKSTTKAELDAIELGDPERYEKIKKSGFHTLIKLNFICAKDGDNDVLIKTAIKHGGDFIVFCREFEKMIVNKKMIKDLLNIEPLTPQEASANIGPLTPQEASLTLSLLKTIASSQLAGHLIFEKLLPPQLRKDLHKQNQVPKFIDSFLKIYYNKINSPKKPDEIKATTPNPIPRSPVSPRQELPSVSP